MDTNSRLLEEWRAVLGPAPLPNGDFVTAEIHYERGGNAIPYFSVTGNVYGPQAIRGEASIKVDGKRYWLHSCGQVRKQIRAAFPELASAMRWHLANVEGPMHYRENGLYWAERAFGVSEWPSRPGDPDPRETFASHVVLGAVEGDVFPSVVLGAVEGDVFPSVVSTCSHATEDCTPARHRAEVRAQVGAWLDARHDALRAAFARDVLAYRARWAP